MDASGFNANGNRHLLVADDEWSIRNVLHEAFLSLGYECTKAASGEETLEMMERADVDIVITDIRMAGLSGVELLCEIKKNYDSDVIVMTGYVGDYTYDEIVEKGASDFVYKPVSTKELLLRVKRVLRERDLLAERNRIFKELQEANHLLQEAYLDTIKRLVLAAEYKDEETGGHLVRMSRYCAFIAEKAGLTEKEVRDIRLSAPMHDIGKIGIPDDILFKPGRLSRIEFNIMKDHTTIGAEILKGSQANVLEFAKEIASCHHEKWSGAGYPNGLEGENIPLPGRIVALADCFDALTSMRPYKGPYPMEIAMEIIRNERGGHFDPDLVDIFMRHSDEMAEIRTSVGATFMPGDDIAWSARDLADGVNSMFHPKKSDLFKPIANGPH